MNVSDKVKDITSNSLESGLIHISSGFEFIDHINPSTVLHKENMLIDASSSSDSKKFLDRFEEVLTNYNRDSKYISGLVLSAEELIQNQKTHLYNYASGKIIDVTFILAKSADAVFISANGTISDEVIKIIREKSTRESYLYGKKGGRGSKIVRENTDFYLFPRYHSECADVIIARLHNYRNVV